MWFSWSTSSLNKKIPIFSWNLSVLSHCHTLFSLATGSCPLSFRVSWCHFLESMVSFSHLLLAIVVHCPWSLCLICCANQLDICTYTYHHAFLILLCNRYHNCNYAHPHIHCMYPMSIYDITYGMHLLATFELILHDWICTYIAYIQFEPGHLFFCHGLPIPGY